MAYLYTKRKGKNNYYYLRISKRIGKKVVAKDICKLGKNLSKINIKNLEKNYPEEIKNSKKNIKKILEMNYYLEKSKKHKPKENKYFNREQISEINASLLHYKEKFRKLNPRLKKSILNNFYIHFSVENASIEENTIKLQEAEKMFNQEIFPKNKTLKEVFNLLNTLEILHFIENKKEISLNPIKEIHRMLLQKVSRIKSYRNYELKSGKFRPSKSNLIYSELKKLLLWYNKNKTKIHPLALAILFHHKFEKIYPFSTGNGEIGRILINHILFINSYPPIIIPHKLKDDYLKVLNTADKSVKKDLLNTNMKYYKPLIDFMHRQFVKTYWDNFVV